MIQTGYSPMLSFDVEDMDHTIQTALKLGAMMDGPIKYPAQGKVSSTLYYFCHCEFLF